MPWVPYFQKIQDSDVFIILNHVQYERQNYQNRFNIGDNWYTMSVESGLEPICNKNYCKPTDDWNRIKRRLPQYTSTLSQFDDCITYSLSVTNNKIIQKAAKLLEIDTPIYSDYETDLRSTARLIHICKMWNAKEYLSGISGSKYLDLQLFKAHGIKVVFQDEQKMEKKPLIEKLDERTRVL